jgi:hypothetical protein
MRRFMARGALAAVALAAAASSVSSQQAAPAWRTSEIAGQATAFVAVEPRPGAGTASSYLGFSCGAQPGVKLTGPVAVTGAQAGPLPLSLTFTAGDDLMALRLDVRFSGAVTANAAEAARADLAGERLLIEDVDAVLLRDLAEFLRDAPEGELTVRSEQPNFRMVFPLAEAKAVLTRFLATCPALAKR